MQLKGFGDLRIPDQQKVKKYLGEESGPPYLIFGLAPALCLDS